MTHLELFFYHEQYFLPTDTSIKMLTAFVLSPSWSKEIISQTILATKSTFISWRTSECAQLRK